ncbi:MAG: cell division protein FtsL [candidate division Zixibacteria bacterium]|nr:cell division protein FtsL [candidate division Zixibacteria bacterium]
MRKKFKRKISSDTRFPYFRIILILLLVVGLALVYVWQRVSVIKSAQEIQTLKNQLSNCKAEYKYLSLDVAKLSSAENIERIAQSELGMVTYDQPISFLVEPQNSKKSINLLSKAKQAVKKMTNISENQVEAGEVKHDL